MFKQLVKKRFSLRDFSERPVDKAVIMDLIDTARMAPSAANKQPWLFYVIENPELRKQIDACYGKEWIKSAPVLMVVCGDHQASWKLFDNKDHCDIDVAIAIDHLTLAATDIGLGTCWICKFDAEKCKQLLDLPKHLEAIALLPLGYKNVEPDTNRFDDKRKKPGEIVIWR
jgi:nitroreductase